MDETSTPTPRHIMVISPHPDDAEFGCWATAVTSRQHGNPVTIVVLADTGRRRRDEARAAARSIEADILCVRGLPDGHVAPGPDLTHTLDQYIAGRPHRVVIVAPHPDDSHPDHRAAGSLAQAVTRHGRADLAYYATPTTGLTFTPNLFVPVTDAIVNSRQQALSLHVTQSDRSYLSPDTLRAKDAWWGRHAGTTAAEPLQTVHVVTSLA